MLQFRKPDAGDVPQIEAFRAELSPAEMDGAGALCNTTAEEWLAYNRRMEDRSTPEIVPCLQYALFDDGVLLGMIQIRLALRGYLTRFGGHIGYCVRPSQRRKGYARHMLLKALEICRQEGVPRVLITCLDANIASARTIESCGGRLESIVFDDENYQQYLRRYWIDL